MKRRPNDDGMLATGEREVFRDALKFQLKKNKIIPAELARRADLSRDAISSYMNLRSLPSDETLARIAKALKCKTEELKKGNGDEAPLVCESRSYHNQGFELLVVRMPVPTAKMTEIMSILYPIKMEMLALEAKKQ